jgi:hypothetical protein
VFVIRVRSAVAALVLVAASSNAFAEPTKQECVDANERAQDLRRAGKLRAARDTLALCVSASCPGPVRDDCAQRVTEAAAAQPSIVFVVTDKLETVKVTIDGEPLAERLDGTALDVDPGEHLFRFEGRSGAAEKRLTIREGEKGRRETVALSTPAVGPAIEAGPPTGHPAGHPNGDGSQGTVGLVVGGGGVVGIVVGSVLGLVAKSTYDSATAKCTSVPDNCGLQAQQESQSAHSEALGSTVAFVLGGAALAGGVALYFTAPRERGVTVAARPDGLLVSGAW